MMVMGYLERKMVRSSREIDRMGWAFEIDFGMERGNGVLWVVLVLGWAGLVRPMIPPGDRWFDTFL